jgi:hypothetical protein
MDMAVDLMAQHNADITQNKVYYGTLKITQNSHNYSLKQYLINFHNYKKKK